MTCVFAILWYVMDGYGFIATFIIKAEQLVQHLVEQSCNPATTVQEAFQMLRSLPKASTLLRRLAKFGDDEGLILGAGRAMASGLYGTGVRGTSGQSDRGVNHSKQWELLVHQGYDINPCNSPLHPAVIDAGIEPDSEEELPVQEAYTPESACFGCGPAAVDGLHLRSFRSPGGLEASVVLDKKYCAFPGIINGGIVSALFDCHGNWSAAIALMDRGCLPKPPLTLTFELLVTYQEPTPPNENLIVRSQIMKVKDSSELGAKATVQVDMTLHQLIGGHEKLLATASGIFKKLGALRAL